eukprot:Lankesteria_metandrocarpae@DN34_c0_g1_i1.p1
MQKTSGGVPSVREVVKCIEVQKRSLHHRLCSVLFDAESLYNRFSNTPEDGAPTVRCLFKSSAGCSAVPMVANIRCGSWYIPLARLSANFKSTTGHAFKYNFSNTRPNFSFLEYIDVYGGCILVDSTAKGKVYPDAMNRTVPIWAAVLSTIGLMHHTNSPAAADDDDCSKCKINCNSEDDNIVCAIAELQHRYSRILPCWMPESEESYAWKYLPDYIVNFLKTLSLNTVQMIRRHLRRRILRCYWSNPDACDVRSSAGHSVCTFPATATAFSEAVDSHSTTDSYVMNCSPREEGSCALENSGDDDLSIICYSASSVNTKTIRVNGQVLDYVQGAADDEENWLKDNDLLGLTPEMLWRSRNQILRANNAEACRSILRSSLQQGKLRLAPLSSPRIVLANLTDTVTLAVLFNVSCVSHHDSSTCSKSSTVNDSRSAVMQEEFTKRLLQPGQQQDVKDTEERQPPHTASNTTATTTTATTAANTATTATTATTTTTTANTAANTATTATTATTTTTTANTAANTAT